MGIKTYRPVTPGLRHRTTNDYDDLTGDRPYKPLLVSLPKSGGRDSRGHLSIRNRGGGHKKLYRMVDFRSGTRSDIPGVVETVEYDPNRSSFISLVKYRDGERRYILSPLGLKVGQEIVSSDAQVDILPGQRHAPAIHPPGHGHPQHRAPQGQGRPGGRSRPGPGPRSWPRKATTPKSGCRPPRSARSISTAGR